jgi:hypothetical protein
VTLVAHTLEITEHCAQSICAVWAPLQSFKLELKLGEVGSRTGADLIAPPPNRAAPPGKAREHTPTVGRGREQ